MIELLRKEECNGCCACADVCGTNAIRLKVDEEGFWYPEIDPDKCTSCDLCSRVCPERHVSELKINDFEQPVCYAAIHKNIEVRFDSTSGGLFSSFAEKMYKNGGYVGGAVYDGGFAVKHIVSDQKEDLLRLRGSKYLQSDLSGWFRQIRSLLAKGEKVLVCGTPCQMAGLRRFVKKGTENLIIVDFVCRGINSPGVFRNYLQSLENRAGQKIVAIKAKNKELGWRNLTFKVTLANGKSLYQTKENDLYTRGYLAANAYCRPSCYTCQFKNFPRIADITLADFWGIENVDSRLDNDLGTSMVLINSKKGEAFFETVKEKITFRSVAFGDVLKGNPALMNPLGEPKIERAKFFEELASGSFLDVAEKYFPFPQPTWKTKLRSFAGTLMTIKAVTRLRPGILLKVLKYNFLSQNVQASLFRRKMLLPASHCVMEIRKGASVRCEGAVIFGLKKFKKSKLESRLLVEDGASMEVKGDFVFGYGANIEVFSGGSLLIHGGGGSNIGITIVCAERIEIGQNVMIGRNVTIRDNNGSHYIARQGYKTSRPVLIGDHVWLCEGCTVMPGVKIGDGAIVGAGSLVVSNVPAHALVMGNPAKVIDTDVFWKS